MWNKSYIVYEYVEIRSSYLLKWGAFTWSLFIWLQHLVWSFCLPFLQTLVEAIVPTAATSDRLRCIYWKAVDQSQYKILTLITAHLRHGRQQNRPIASSEDFVAFAEFIEGFHVRQLTQEVPIFFQIITLSLSSLPRNELLLLPGGVTGLIYHWRTNRRHYAISW